MTKHKSNSLMQIKPYMNFYSSKESKIILKGDFHYVKLLNRATQAKKTQPKFRVKVFLVIDELDLNKEYDLNGEAGPYAEVYNSKIDDTTRSFFEVFEEASEQGVYLTLVSNKKFINTIRNKFKISSERVNLIDGNISNTPKILTLSHIKGDSGKIYKKCTYVLYSSKQNFLEYMSNFDLGILFRSEPNIYSSILSFLSSKYSAKF